MQQCGWFILTLWLSTLKIEAESLQSYTFMDDVPSSLDQEQNVAIPAIYIFSPIYFIPTLHSRPLKESKRNEQVGHKAENPKTKINEIYDIEVFNRGKVPKREADTIKQTSMLNEEITSYNDIENSTTIPSSTLLESNTKITKEEDSESLSSNNVPVSQTNESEIANSTIDEDIHLPPINDDRWNKFNVNWNVNNINPGNETSNETSVNKWPYSAALYNNIMIDQLSITTNSYTNSEPLPPRSDRWASFDSLKGGAKSSEFRPLAGLYYDGFLHTPVLKLTNFVPYNVNYNN